VTVFLDTNILVYSYDRLSGEKHEAAVNLIGKLVKADTVIVSTQVINEFIVVMTGKVKHPVSLETAESHVKKFEKVFDVRPIQMVDCIKAISIARRYGFSYWDSLIIAAALNSGCAKLYSEDLQHGQVVAQKVLLQNPFQ
jgi:predicted nucleic acid-binding protein